MTNSAKNNQAKTQVKYSENIQSLVRLKGKSTKLLLQMLLDAQKLGADQLSVESPKDADSEATIDFYVSGGDDSMGPIKTVSMAKADAYLLTVLLRKQCFHWPDADDRLMQSNKRGSQRILLAPLSAFRLLADLSIRQDSNSDSFSANLNSIVWNDIPPITDRISFSLKNKEFILTAAKQKTGLVLTNSGPEPMLIDGSALLLALRPDALFFRGLGNESEAQLALAAAADHLVVIALDSLDPVDMIYNFLAHFPAAEDTQEAASRLILSLVHRRVLRTCGICARSTQVPPTTLERLPEGLREQAVETYMFSRGCTSCGNSAYHGTVGLDSVVRVSSQIRSLLASGENAESVTRAAYKEGARALLEDGLSKIYDGMTSFEQVFSVTNQISSAFALVISEKIVEQADTEQEEEDTAQEAKEQQLDDKSTIPAPPDRKRRLLIVEDEMDQREILQIVFQKEGFDVVGAENGRDALGVLASDYFDIVLCDVMMPVMNGIDFIKELRKLPMYKNIPVLMLTAVENQESEEALLTYGADDYCRKNIKRKVLLERVNRVIERKRKGNPVGHLLED